MRLHEIVFTGFVSLALFAACGDGGDGDSGSSGGGTLDGGGGSLCTPPESEPSSTPFARVTPSFDGADPTATRLCDEGSTPPSMLANPWDLHCAIAAGLGASVMEEGGAPPSALRIVTWNIRFGTDLAGVTALLKDDPVLSKADVLLLEEVDRGCDRSGKVDVARSIAQALGMDWVFGVEFVEHSQGGCEEGNAVLSRFPLGNPVHRFHNVGKLSRGDLRAPEDWSESADEPRTGRRSFMGADIRFGGGLLHLVAAHLENKSDPGERAGEAGEILGLIDMLPRRRACVAGDFNVFPDIGSPPIDAPLFDRFEAACYSNPHGDMPQEERRTRPSIGYQIDFTYIRALRVAGRGVRNEIAEVPSDHYPVWVDVEEL